MGEAVRRGPQGTLAWPIRKLLSAYQVNITPTSIHLPRCLLGFFLAALVLFPASGLAQAKDKSLLTAAIEPAPSDEERAKAALAGAESDELDLLRQEFKKSVFTPTLERINKIIKRNPDAASLQRILNERVKRLTEFDPAYLEQVRQDILRRTHQGQNFAGHSQYFVYADVNPKTQLIFVCYYDAQTQKIEVVGTDLISSGELNKGFDYYVTPTGVFENLVENFGYRALGTPNQEGWRGLGPKGCRVWDFGYQKSVKIYKGGQTKSEMRLLLHATDPVAGEVRLGRADSKGCVRISQGLNHFLDKFAILDQNYEDWLKSKKKSWLMDQDRSPVKHPGKFMIVGDSSEPQ